MSIIVRQPLNQWLYIEKNIALIYYPDEQKAIKLRSLNLILLPFFQSFIGMIERDMGLPKLGYTIEKHMLSGDTLCVYWSPPKSQRNNLGTVVTCLMDDKILCVKTYHSNGIMAGQTIYENYIQHDEQLFPLAIQTVSYSGTATRSELIRYSEPVFSDSLPDSITRFLPPIDVEIKEVDW